VITQDVIDPEKNPAEKSRSSDYGSSKIVDYPSGLVKRAYPEAVRTIRAVFCPKSETLLGIHIPLQGPGLIGDIVAFRGHLAMGYGLVWTVSGALLTYFTELLDTEGPIVVVAERKICKDLTESDSRTEFFSNQ